MKNATILVLQEVDAPTSELSPLISVANAQNARLSVLQVGIVPVLTAFSVGAAPYAVPLVADEWVMERNLMGKRLSAKQTETRAFLKKQGLAGDVGIASVGANDLHDVVALRATYADVCVVLGSIHDDKSAFSDAMFGLLFEGPGPVLLNADKNNKALSPENILIAWDGSLPSARAVRAAMPLLSHAKEVTVACIDPKATKWDDGESPGADLADWLSLHGCRVTVQEYASGGKKTSEVIQNRAKETGADLVVMGGYGRSRLNERIFGGTTLSMINQRDVPVFLVH